MPNATPSRLGVVNGAAATKSIEYTQLNISLDNSDWWLKSTELKTKHN